MIACHLNWPGPQLVFRILSSNLFFANFVQRALDYIRRAANLLYFTRGLEARLLRLSAVLSLSKPNRVRTLTFVFAWAVAIMQCISTTPTTS
jgi:hypothetical protein